MVAPNFLLTNAIGQGKGFLATPPGKARLLESLRAKLKAAHLPAGAADRVEQILAKEVYPAANRQQAALEAALGKADDRAGVWAAEGRRRLLRLVPEGRHHHGHDAR